MAAIVAVIVIVTIVALIFLLNTPPKIDITYSSKYGNTQRDYGVNNTYILFYLNVSTTRDCQFDFGTLSLTCNGQPITPIATTNTDKINLQSRQVNQWQLDYTVEGDVKGNFQLVYNGTAQVTLNGSDSVAVKS